MSFGVLPSACLMHFNFLIHIYWVTGSWLVRSQIILLLNLSGHLIFNRKLTNAAVDESLQPVGNAFREALAKFTRHIERVTDLTFVSKMGICSLCRLRTISKMNPGWWMSISHFRFWRAFTSSSVPAVVETMTPGHARDRSNLFQIYSINGYWS